MVSPQPVRMGRSQSRKTVAQDMGGQDQAVVQGPEKGARFGEAYLSESEIFGRQVPFCLDLGGPAF